MERMDHKEIFPEKTDDLRRYSTFSSPTGWNGNYISIGAKISISTACESAHTYTNFLGYHDPPMRLQVFRLHGKSLSFRHGKFPEFQTENFGKI